MNVSRAYVSLITSICCTGLMALAGCSYDASGLSHLRCTPNDTAQKGTMCVDGFWVHTGDAGLDAMQDVGSCTHEDTTSFCTRQGFECGQAQGIDNCGVHRVDDCGVCPDKGNCAGNICSCAPEDLTALCTRVGAECGFVDALNNCGTMLKNVACGISNCGDPNLVCTNNVCVCKAETDDAFCARHSAQCGRVHAKDNCDMDRQVDCGMCSNNELCQDDNTCPTCQPESDLVLCKNNKAECGTLNVEDLCSMPRTIDCTAALGPCNNNQTCVNNTCTCPNPTCNERVCGDVQNACGKSTTCGFCAPNERCNDQGSCTCNEAVCPVGAHCGTFTNSCGQSTRCGQDTCADPNDMCVDNFCVCAREDAKTLCQRLHKTQGIQCGDVSVVDNCGLPVHIDCSMHLPACGQDRQCVGNACVCDALSCPADFCGTVSNACDTLDCSSNCGMDKTCMGTACVCDTPSCEPDFCGIMTNSCGASTNCSLSCGMNKSCNTTTQMCTCDPLTCTGNYCGVLTNACSVVDCVNNCGTDEICTNTTCTCDKPICPANYCGTFTNACKNTIDCNICAGTDSCISHVCTHVAFTPSGAGLLGTSMVFVDINTLAVGAPGYDSAAGTDQGGVFIYTRNIATGMWTQSNILTPPDAVAGEAFGFSLDSDGSRLIVGAPKASRNGGMQRGAAFIYTFTQGGLFSHQITLHANNQNRAQFGYAVAIDGPIAAIGAPYRNSNNNVHAVGRIYVYELAQGVWGSAHPIERNTQNTSDRLGFDLDLDASTGRLLAGAPQDATAQNDHATLFTRVLDKNWVEHSGIFGTTQGPDQNGMAVALVDGLILVGAPDFDNSNPNIDNDFGTVRIFYPASTWDMSFDLAPPQTLSFGYGWRIAHAGSTLAITANRRQTVPTSPTSQAQVYYGNFDTSSRTFTPRILTGEHPDDLYGDGIALIEHAGETLMSVGAPGANSNGGKVYIYTVR